jgi:hypothetical protein
MSTALEAGGDRHDQSLQEHPDGPSVTHEARTADGETDLVHARPSAPQRRAPNDRPIVESPPLHDDRQPEGANPGIRPAAACCGGTGLH